MDSARLSCFMLMLCFHFLSTHIPASTRRDYLYMYPRCGVDNDIYRCIFSLYSYKDGKAARVTTPPRLCPTKDRRPSMLPGQYSKIKAITSRDSYKPCYAMLSSVRSSFTYDHKNSVLGY